MVAKFYQHDETALVWKDSGGDEAFTLQNLGAAAGRNGALHDFGTAARAALYAWRLWVKFAATTNLVVGDEVYVYWRTSDGVSPDNDDGTGDVALSHADKLKNLLHIGTLLVDEVSSTALMVKSGVVWVEHRWGGPVVYNNAGEAFVNTANVCGFSLTPIPMESQ